MARRVTLEVLATLGITIVVSWLLLGMVSLVDLADPWWAAFVDGAPRLLFGVTGIALALWTIMVLIGSIAHRNRRAGWRIATHLVSLFVAILINVIVFVVMAFANTNEGGWGLLLAGIALGVGLVLGVSGAVAVLLVELVILRPQKVVEPAAMAPETPE